VFNPRCRRHLDYNLLQLHYMGMCNNNELVAVHTEIIAKTTEPLIDTYDYMKHNALQRALLCVCAL
jgi:hypothetical protein